MGASSRHHLLSLHRRVGIVLSLHRRVVVLFYYTEGLVLFYMVLYTVYCQCHHPILRDNIVSRSIFGF